VVWQNWILPFSYALLAKHSQIDFLMLPTFVLMDCNLYFDIMSPILYLLTAATVLTAILSQFSNFFQSRILLWSIWYDIGSVWGAESELVTRGSCHAPKSPHWNSSRVNLSHEPKNEKVNSSHVTQCGEFLGWVNCTVNSSQKPRNDKGTRHMWRGHRVTSWL